MRYLLDLGVLSKTRKLCPRPGNTGLPRPRCTTGLSSPVTPRTSRPPARECRTRSPADLREVTSAVWRSGGPRCASGGAGRPGLRGRDQIVDVELTQSRRGVHDPPTGHGQDGRPAGGRRATGQQCSHYGLHHLPGVSGKSRPGRDPRVAGRMRVSPTASGRPCCRWKPSSGQRFPPTADSYLTSAGRLRSDPCT